MNAHLLGGAQPVLGDVQVLEEDLPAVSETRPRTYRARRRLLVDFLEHEVLVPPFSAATGPQERCVVFETACLVAVMARRTA